MWNRSMNPRDSARPPLLIDRVPMTWNSLPTGSKWDCIRLRNMPPKAEVLDVLIFLGDLAQHVVLQGVRMLFSLQGEPIGEAFIQLDSEDSSQLIESQLDGKPMYCKGQERTILIQPISRDIMARVLTNCSYVHGLPAGILQAPARPRQTSVPLRPVAFQPQVAVSLSQRPMFMTPPAMMSLTAPSFQLTSLHLPPQMHTRPGMGAIPMVQLPQPMQTTAFPPAMAPIAQRPPVYLPIGPWYLSPSVSP